MSKTFAATAFALVATAAVSIVTDANAQEVEISSTEIATATAQFTLNTADRLSIAIKAPNALEDRFASLDDLADTKVELANRDVEPLIYLAQVEAR